MLKRSDRLAPICILITIRSLLDGKRLCNQVCSGRLSGKNSTGCRVILEVIRNYLGVTQQIKCQLISLDVKEQIPLDC